MSGPTGRIAALFDTVAEDYETVGPPFFDHFGALLVEHTGVHRGDRVLDLAAGSGSVSVPALAAAGPQGTLLAVDLADGMVRRLPARLRTSGHADARAVVGDVAALPASHEPFDVVLCGFALFVLPDPPAALRSWALQLRPGGRLGLSTWARQTRCSARCASWLVRSGSTPATAVRPTTTTRSFGGPSRMPASPTSASRR